MRLVELNPRFIDAGGQGVSTADGSPATERHGIGLIFDCPHGVECPSKRGVEFPENAGRHFVAFDNPLDGLGAVLDGRHPHWVRTGNTFETLTLSPSIRSLPEGGGCGWHGYIRDGEIVPA